MTVVLLTVGVGLIALVAYDAITTTLRISGAAAGPITFRVAGGWWRTARRLSSRQDSPLMTSAGTVVVLLTIAVWLVLLWAGWTLVFSAEPQAVISSSSRTPAGGWSRVYFAGFTAFTLGVGDYIPNGQPWELLTAVAVLSGLGLTTLAITYLVPVVGAVVDRRVQAESIASLGPSPQEVVAAGLGDHPFPYLEHRLQALADSLLMTAERHLAYPVLHYFHSARRSSDLRSQALVLDEALTLLQHGVAPAVRPHPATLDAVRHALARLAERATGGDTADDPVPPPPGLEALRDADVPTVDDQAFTLAVQGLDDHRRRVARFAAESLW